MKRRWFALLAVLVAVVGACGGSATVSPDAMADLGGHSGPSSDETVVEPLDVAAGQSDESSTPTPPTPLAVAPTPTPTPTLHPERATPTPTSTATPVETGEPGQVVDPNDQVFDLPPEYVALLDEGTPPTRSSTSGTSTTRSTCTTTRSVTSMTRRVRHSTCLANSTPTPWC